MPDCRECTDLGTDSESAPISADQNWIRSNKRSVIDPFAVSHLSYQFIECYQSHNHRHKVVISLFSGYQVLCRKHKAYAGR